MAAALVKARTGERNNAKRGAEDDRIRPLAAPWPAADRAAPMPGSVTRRLGRDQALLDAGQQRLGLGERQAERLQPVVALVEEQEFGVVADHAFVLRDNPELNLDTHAHSASGYVGGPAYPPPPSPATPASHGSACTPCASRPPGSACL